MSVEYYTRLERGALGGASPTTLLDALAGALRLDDAERSHLHDLARAAVPTRTRRARPEAGPRLRPSIQRMLDGMPRLPAFVRSSRLNIVAVNALGEALYTQAFANPVRPVNLARFVSLDPRAALLHPNWDESARTTVALLRTAAGRTPYDKGLTDLVGELSTRSEPFRVRWAAHEVRLHHHGGKHFHHPEVGDLQLTYDALNLPGTRA